MTPLEAIQARKSEAEAAHAQAAEAARAADAKQAETYRVLQSATREADDAEEWSAIPKAARKRVLALSAETVAAFCKTYVSTGGDRVSEWLALKLKKEKIERVFIRRETFYLDTKDGTAARILHRRGREWCESLEVTP